MDRGCVFFLHTQWQINLYNPFKGTNELQEDSSREDEESTQGMERGARSREDDEEEGTHERNKQGGFV